MATVEIDHQQVLRKALQNKRPELIQQLNSSTLFLTYLAKFKLIQPGDILKYERMSETRKRNTELIDCILEKDDDVLDGYSKFLEALKKSDQEHLAAMLTNVDKEIDIVDAYQNVLSDHLTDIRKYLKTESRRAEVRFAAPSPETAEVPQKGTGNIDREQITEFLFKVHQLTKNTLVQFERCKQVIDKLHHDCNDVARKNGHMLDKLRECDKLVSDLLQCFGVQHNAIQYHDNTGAVVGHAFRTKKDESEMLMANMRLNIGMLNDRLEEANADKTACMEIIDNILKDIYGRKTSLGKYSEPPPKDNRLNKYMHNVKLPPIDNNSSLVTRSPTMSYKIAELADNLQSYVHHESQVTHKMNISKFQGTVAHRNFDKVDHDLLHLQKELYRDGNEVATSLIKQIIEITRLEREDCLRMVEDLEKNVANRRQKIMDTSSGIKPRKITQRKTERSRETNFSHRMAELSKEVKRYMDIEQEHGQKSKTGQNKKKLEYDNQLKAITHQMSNMERQLREVTNEKEKYKRLYEQEKMGKPLTRPVIPKRGETKQNSMILPPLTSEVSGKKITRGPRLTFQAQNLASLKENIREKRKAALVRPMPRQDDEQRSLSRASSHTSYSRIK